MTDTPRPPGIARGDTICLHFCMQRREDGMVIDDTRGGEPYRFVMGSDAWPPAIETRFAGLTAGQSAHWEFAADKAYGLPDPDALQTIPRALLPSEWEVTEGRAFVFSLPDGQEAVGVVRAMTDQSVDVDFSHPLAGCDIVLDVWILDVTSAEVP